MTTNTTDLDLGKLSPEVLAQLSDAPKKRGRKPGIKNRPKARSYHGFELGKSRGRFIHFNFQGQPGQKVFLAAYFNGWNPAGKLMKETADGKYTLRCLVPEGRHEYKFVVDGSWMLDEANPERSCNDRGDWNSVIVVD